MASRMIGRATCPECGFASAHVKQSDKCTYRYCPECGAQHHAKNARQVADLNAKTRPLETPSDPKPTATPTEPKKIEPAADLPGLPTPTEPSPTPAKRRGLFA